MTQKDTKQKYEELKSVALGLIKKFKKNSPELGAYLERHIVIEDNNETVKYTGKLKVIELIMKKTRSSN